MNSIYKIQHLQNIKAMDIINIATFCASAVTIYILAAEPIIGFLLYLWGDNIRLIGEIYRDKLDWRGDIEQYGIALRQRGRDMFVGRQGDNIFLDLNMDDDDDDI